MTLYPSESRGLYSSRQVIRPAAVRPPHGGPRTRKATRAWCAWGGVHQCKQRQGGTGMTLIETGDAARGNPLDVVERLAASNDWSFERAGDDEITILVRGKWADYQVSFTWMADLEALHMACAFELKVPDHARPEVATLISLINEQMWIGQIGRAHV